MFGLAQRLFVCSARLIYAYAQLGASATTMGISPVCEWGENMRHASISFDRSTCVSAAAALTFDIYAMC